MTEGGEFRSASRRGDGSYRAWIIVPPGADPYTADPAKVIVGDGPTPDDAMRDLIVAAERVR